MQKLLDGYISVDTGFLVATCNETGKKLTSWMFLTFFFAGAARTLFDGLHLERLASGDLVLVDFQIFDADDSNNDAILVPRSINGSRLNFPSWSIIVH